MNLRALLRRLTDPLRPQPIGQTSVADLVIEASEAARVLVTQQLSGQPADLPADAAEWATRARAASLLAAWVAAMVTARAAYEHRDPLELWQEDAAFLARCDDEISRG